MTPVRARLPQLATAVALAIGSTWAFSGCTPPPSTVCPTIPAAVNVHDSTHQGVMHLSMREIVCVDPWGTITNNTGAQFQSAYGFLAFSGEIIHAYPMGASGRVGDNVLGGRRGADFSHSFTGTWDIKEVVGIPNTFLSFTSDKGTCVFTMPILVIGGGGTQNSSVQAVPGNWGGYCHDGFYLSTAS